MKFDVKFTKIKNICKIDITYPYSVGLVTRNILYYSTIYDYNNDIAEVQTSSKKNVILFNMEYLLYYITYVHCILFTV